MRWQLQNVWGGKWAFFWKGALFHMNLATSCQNHRGITKQGNHLEQTTVLCRCCTDCGYWKKRRWPINVPPWPMKLFWAIHEVKIMSNSALNLHVCGKLTAGCARCCLEGALQSPCWCPVVWHRGAEAASRWGVNCAVTFHDLFPLLCHS